MSTEKRAIIESDYRAEQQTKVEAKAKEEGLKGQWCKHMKEKLGECTTDEGFIAAIEGFKKHASSAPYIGLAHDIHKKWRDENNVEVNNDRP